MVRRILFFTAILGFCIVSQAHAGKIDSLYADSIITGFGVSGEESGLHKPDQSFAHLGQAVEYDLAFKRYAGTVATNELVPIKVGANVTVYGKPDPGVERSALAIILVKYAFDGSLQYQSDPVTMEGTEKTITVTGQPYDFVLLTLADSSTSFYVDAVLLAEDTSQPSSVLLPGYRVPAVGLVANYPNPFSNATNVQFSVPVAGNASLVAVDMQGNEHGRAELGYLNEGEHRVPFDLRDHGMYFLRLFVNGMPVGNPIKVISQ